MVIAACIHGTSGMTKRPKTSVHFPHRPIMLGVSSLVQPGYHRQFFSIICAMIVLGSLAVTAQQSPPQPPVNWLLESMRTSNYVSPSCKLGKFQSNPDTPIPILSFRSTIAIEHVACWCCIRELLPHSSLAPFNSMLLWYMDVLKCPAIEGVQSDTTTLRKANYASGNLADVGASQSLRQFKRPLRAPCCQTG